MKTDNTADVKIVRGSRIGVYDVIDSDGNRLSHNVTHLQAISDAAYEAKRLANGWAPSYEDIDGEQIAV